MASTTWSLLMLTMALLASPGSAAPMETIYEVLRFHGFPPGLVPRDVVSGFEWNPNSGQFMVHLNHTCEFKAFRYEVQYLTQISGVIEDEEIKNLRGVEVKIMNYYWAHMVAIEINDDGDTIAFTVGRSTAEFPFYNFYHIPECGCGFECGRSK